MSTRLYAWMGVCMGFAKYYPCQLFYILLLCCWFWSLLCACRGVVNNVYLALRVALMQMCMWTINVHSFRWPRLLRPRLIWVWVGPTVALCQIIVRVRMIVRVHIVVLIRIFAIVHRLLNSFQQYDIWPTRHRTVHCWIPPLCPSAKSFRSVSWMLHSVTCMISINAMPSSCCMMIWRIFAENETQNLS